MLNAAELVELEDRIAHTRARGERWMRGLWQFTLAFSFICFSYVFFLPKVSASPSINNFPILVIIVFGVVMISILVLGDTVFFNKAYTWEGELEEELSGQVAALLALEPKATTLRKGPPGKGYVLTLSLNKKKEVSERIALETSVIALKYRVQAESSAEALRLIEASREKFFS